jgi:CO/xanthine dehydrogenase Mo-binding subunit
VLRSIVIRHGDPDAAGEVSVEGVYELGIQDQAFLGPESGLAVPTARAGSTSTWPTQWLHVDRDQVAPCLGPRAGQVRIHLAGVGGAFGGREDLSMQVHGRDARAAHRAGP